MKFDAEGILEFWFAEDALTPQGYKARKDLWFQVNDVFDSEIINRFEPQIDLAAQASKAGFATEARINLARIIATDQFPRNVYRGTPKAFSFDSVALGITQSMIDSGMHEQLNFVERLFAYMPLQHAESAEIQQLSVDMFSSLSTMVADPIFHAGAEESADFAKLHKQIIDDFGRFPHRNDILKRESTAEELAYLDSGAETFGQVKR